MKKLLKLMLSTSLLFLLVVCLAPASKAEAAVKQNGIAKNSITLSWDAEKDAVNYQVYIDAGSNYTREWTLYKTLAPSQTSITITGLPAGCEKSIRVEYEYYSYDGTKTYTSVAGTVYDAKTLPGKVTGLKQEKWWYFALVFDATWDKQEGADGYEYIVKDSKGKKKASEKKASLFTSFSVSKISNNQIYTAQVRAYTEFEGKTYYGEWSNTAYFFTQPRVNKASVSKNKLQIKWGKVSGATGYDVYVSTKPRTGYKKVKSVGKKVSSVTIKKFKNKKISSKKKYYVYVATKKKVGKTTYTSGKLYYWDTKSTSFGYFT